jgi:branched-chain amino acid transport system permease protein
VSGELSQVITSTLFSGALYVLVGTGFVILYRATGVMNFAQGGFMVLGSYLFYTFAVTTHWGLVPGLFTGVVASALIGGLIFGVIFRRMTAASTFVIVIATFGLNIVVVAAVQLIWGSDIRSLPEYLNQSPHFHVLGLGFSDLLIFTVVVVIVVVGLLELLLRATRVGVQMRAVASNVLLATFSNLRASRASALAWALAASCATIGGVCYSMQSAVDPASLQNLGILTFAPLLLGGLDSVLGVLVGGILVAFVQSLVSVWFGGEWSVVVSYLTILLVLLVRPQGIFGSTKVARL